MRTRKGAARRQATKRLLKRASGYVGGRRKLLRTAKETLVRAGVFAFRDRRARKRQFRRLWITRLSAACAQHELRYSQFIYGLTKANIQLDRKQLSELAIQDPAGFALIVEKVKAALAA
ncbi:MAG: 50S ribosomal protein L20 [Pirellulales bacterium]